MNLDLNKPVQATIDRKWFAAKIVEVATYRAKLIDDEGLPLGTFTMPACAFRNTPEPPRRVPYTAETWPAWAVWVRERNRPEIRRSVRVVSPDGLLIASDKVDFDLVAEHYEISGTDGVWHPASREVQP